jgi:hypothetical protein
MRKAIDRRRFVRDSSAALAAGVMLPLPSSARESALPAGTVASSVLHALDGKRPRVKRSLSARVRATARDGSRHPDALARNPAGYHHNVVQRVEYRVA